MENIVLHPPLVHFPIAFYFLELLLLLFWQAKKDAAYLRFARFSFNLGYLFMLLAIPAGLVDAGGWAGIAGKVKPHFYGAVAVFGIYTARVFVWRYGQRRGGVPPPVIVQGRGYLTPTFLHLAGAFIGTLVVFLTAFLGGEIVY